MIETPRLLLRSFNAKDAELVYAYLSDEESMYYLPDPPYSFEQTISFIKEKEGSLFRVVERKSDGRILGHISFEPWFGDHTYEIGWVFHKDYHGKGYGTEAAQAVLDTAFKSIPKLHRVIATCQPENAPSWKVMEHLNMRREGTFLQCIPVENGWWDEYYYAILKSEWELNLKSKT